MLEFKELVTLAVVINIFKKFQLLLSEYFNSKHTTTYWQRINYIIGPAIKEDFDKIEQKETRNAIENFVFHHSAKKTILLDAGCNTGVEGYRLFKKGYKGSYIGVDNNRKAIQYAKQNLSEFKDVNLFPFDLNDIPFPDKYFDIILIKDVIEHQKNYYDILFELTRLTKKYLILSLFIKLSAANDDTIVLHPDGYYLNKYSRNSLANFFTKRGFKKPKLIYTNKQDEVFMVERI